VPAIACRLSLPVRRDWRACGGDLLCEQGNKEGLSNAHGYGQSDDSSFRDYDWADDRNPYIQVEDLCE